MILNGYKNVIFDLGGVLLNLDYKRTEDAFVKLGLKNFDAIYSQHLQTELFEKFETGAISSSQFRAGIKAYLDNNITDTEIDDAWNAMLLDFPPERIHFLEKLKTTHRIFLLSNTNDIHLAAYSNYMRHTFGFDNELAHVFERQYYSNKVGMRKPNNDIFNFVLRENKLNATETLFIDDSQQHIATAKKSGINTYWLDTKKETILGTVI